MSRLPQDRRKVNRPRPLAATPAGTLPASEFPKVSLTGGPSPRDLHLAIDGKPVRSHDLQILASVDRAVVTVITRQYVELDIRLADAEVVAGGYVVVVRRPREEGVVLLEMEEVSRGEGKTYREAVDAALDNLPADPAQETH